MFSSNGYKSEKSEVSNRGKMRNLRTKIGHCASADAMETGCGTLPSVIHESCSHNLRPQPKVQQHADVVCVRVRSHSRFSCATGKQPRIAPSSIRRFARHGSLVAWQFGDAVLVWNKIAQDIQPGEVVRLAQQREQQLQQAFMTIKAEPEEQRQHLNQWSIPDWAIPIDSTEKRGLVAVVE